MKAALQKILQLFASDDPGSLLLAFELLKQQPLKDQKYFLPACVLVEMEEKVPEVLESVNFSDYLCSKLSNKEEVMCMRKAYTDLFMTTSRYHSYHVIGYSTFLHKVKDYWSDKEELSLEKRIEIWKLFEPFLTIRRYLPGWYYFYIAYFLIREDKDTSKVGHYLDKGFAAFDELSYYEPVLDDLCSYLHKEQKLSIPIIQKHWNEIITILKQNPEGSKILPYLYAYKGKIEMAVDFMEEKKLLNHINLDDYLKWKYELIDEDNKASQLAEIIPAFIGIPSQRFAYLAEFFYDWDKFEESLYAAYWYHHYVNKNRSFALGLKEQVQYTKTNYTDLEQSILELEKEYFNESPCLYKIRVVLHLIQHQPQSLNYLQNSLFYIAYKTESQDIIYFLNAKVEIEEAQDVITYFKKLRSINAAFDQPYEGYSLWEAATEPIAEELKECIDRNELFFQRCWAANKFLGQDALKTGMFFAQYPNYSKQAIFCFEAGFKKANYCVKYVLHEYLRLRLEQDFRKGNKIEELAELIDWAASRTIYNEKDKNVVDGYLLEMRELITL